MALEETTETILSRREFGRRLRECRKSADMKLRAVEEALSFYKGKLSKIERGDFAADEEELEALISLYQPNRQVADELRDLADQARKRTYSGRVGGTSRQYVALEAIASEIRMVYGEVPGIFQIHEYAVGQMSRSPVVPPTEIQRYAEGRAQRSQRLFLPDGPRSYAVLGEEALYRQVGGREVLRQQIKQMYDLAELPHVSIRILRFEAGACPALSVPFTVLNIPEEGEVVYVESLTRVDYIKNAEPYVRALFTGVTSRVDRIRAT
jgi:transcriptional regulator with XRE-family HTH domain